MRVPPAVFFVIAVFAVVTSPRWENGGEYFCPLAFCVIFIFVYEYDTWTAVVQCRYRLIWLCPPEMKLSLVQICTVFVHVGGGRGLNRIQRSDWAISGLAPATRAGK